MLNGASLKKRTFETGTTIYGGAFSESSIFIKRIVPRENIHSGN